MRFVDNITELDEESVSVAAIPSQNLRIVEHRQWRAAKRALLAAVEQPGCVTLVGPAGTGKTLLLNWLAKALVAGGRDVTLLPGKTLAGIKDPSGRPAVVLIDIIARPLPAGIEALARFKVVCVLAGAPSIVDAVRWRYEKLTVVEMPVLDPDGQAALLSGYLEHSGQSHVLFSPAAVAVLARRSAGVPRALLFLARFSVFLALMEGALSVSAVHVEAAGELGRESGLCIDEISPAAVPASDEWPHPVSDDAASIADEAAGRGRGAVVSPPLKTPLPVRQGR